MLTVQTNVNTSDLLEGVDIINLGEAYIRTLTKEQDRRQTLNGYLVKQQDTFFAFNPALASLVTNTTIETTQTISKTLQECYTDIIASLLLAGEPLPTHIRIGACINHPSNNHWTMLLTACTHDEDAKKEYQDIYTRYQADPLLKEGEHPRPLNAAKNFLKNQKQLIFTGDIEGTPSNWTLPINHVKIALTHYDSLAPGTATTAYKEIEISSKAFREKHQASLKPMPCAPQQGNTCADWSAYNAFVQGFQRKPKLFPSSETLRFLFHYRSIVNVRRILSYSKKTTLLATSEKDQISFPSASEEQACRELSRTIPPVTQPTAAASPPISIQLEPEECNDLYPTINLLSKILFTLLCAYIVFSLIPATILPSFISFSLGLVIGFFTYDAAVLDCFGKKEIILTPIKGKFPDYEGKEIKSGIFQELSFTFAPYHKELKTLEKEIASMIGERSDQKDIVRCFIKHRIYPRAKEYFYKEDIDKINSADYIQNEKRILDSCTTRTQGPARSR